MSNRIRNKTQVVIACATDDKPWCSVSKGDIILAVKIPERAGHNAYQWHFLNAMTAACYSLTATDLREGWTVLKELSLDDLKSDVLWQQLMPLKRPKFKRVDLMRER